MNSQIFANKLGLRLIFTKKISAFICVYLWLIFLPFYSSAQTYKNPVIPGDFPDPSVIRVGEDYYATATTGGWSPQFSILHSKDLINWKIVGAVFNQKPSWAKGDFWAPEIVEDKGRFFVYYTARRDEGKNKKGTLCVAVAVADKPDGVWQDKGALVCQEMGSIDADFARDENGKPFLIWKEDGNDRQKPTWLYAQELDESGTKLLGKPKKLFRNTEPWEGNVIEGAYVLRRGDWFYLFYSGNACCGRSCNYALGVARSKTLLGKWEKNPKNPILPANETWQCPGHGSIVSTPDNRNFLLYHAYRKGSEGFNIGREALLDEVKFIDGWAMINNGKGASVSAAVPLENAAQNAVKNVFDEFSESVLNPFWQMPMNSLQSEILENGFLKLSADKTQNETEAVVAERTISGDYTATTLIKFDAPKAGERAGISAYSWRGNAVGISVEDGKIFSWRRENNKEQIVGRTELSDSQVYLRMVVKDGEIYNFFYSANGENWMKLGESINAAYVEGARVALIYSGKTASPGAKFDWLKVEQN